VFLVATRWCLVVCWALYLSYVTVGQDFLSFQWDNLLLESAFFAFFVASWRLDGRKAPPPHPVGVFLMQWLFLRLMVESGAAKLLTGDPTWRDLTAMATYYETAPLPTWVGWWMHQLPLWFHKGTSGLTFVIELVLPLFVWGPRRLRRLAFAGIVGFQAFVVLTANYGFFNYLSAALRSGCSTTATSACANRPRGRRRRGLRRSRSRRRRSCWFPSRSCRSCRSSVRRASSPPRGRSTSCSTAGGRSTRTTSSRR
jgi:hypothetical protein